MGSRRSDGGLIFADPEGLEHELLDQPRTRGAAASRVTGDPRRARPARLRGGPRLRPPIRATVTACSSGAWASSGPARAAGASAASSAAAPGCMTRRPRDLRCREPAACTTSPSPARWPTTTLWRAAGAIEGGAHPDARDRPLLLPLDLLSRAQRGPVRDSSTTSRPRLRRRRGRGAPRGGALAAAQVRAPARAVGGQAHAAPVPPGMATGRPHLSVLRLVTIPISHYCEKARWALDRAGIGYHEEPPRAGDPPAGCPPRRGRRARFRCSSLPTSRSASPRQILEWVDRRTDPSLWLFAGAPRPSGRRCGR